MNEAKPVKSDKERKNESSLLPWLFLPNRTPKSLSRRFPRAIARKQRFLQAHTAFRGSRAHSRVRLTESYDLLPIPSSWLTANFLYRDTRRPGNWLYLHPPGKRIAFWVGATLNPRGQACSSGKAVRLQFHRGRDSFSTGGILTTQCPGPS